MIRRLRWKIVAINMAMVTAVLLAVAAFLYVNGKLDLLRYNDGSVSEMGEIGAEEDQDLDGTGLTHTEADMAVPEGSPFADEDVLNILLQILDDGEITDAHGRKVNFENTVIVMTSNAGSDKSAGGTVGFGRSSDEQDKERVMKALQSFLRPEFINRVDEIVYFHQLTKENFAGIARIMLRELTESLSAKGFTFTYDDTLVAYLVDKSYSAAYGARNLRRCIQKELEDPMAVRIIESFDHPITHIRASASGEKVTLETL